MFYNLFMKRLTKTYIQHCKCPECGSDAIVKWCPPSISTKCTKCGYAISSTLFHPIDSDETEYSVSLESHQEVSKSNLSILSELTGFNYIKCKEMLIKGGILKNGLASDVNDLIDTLSLSNIKFNVKPEWKYYCDPLDFDKNWTRKFDEKLN